MSDLISRSKLLKEIETWGGCVEALHEYIANMPTSYDASRVIEELEYNRKDVPEDKDYYSWISAIDNAIEIVKQGGIDDDVCEWKQISTARYRTSCGYKLEEYFDTKACYCKQCGRKIKEMESDST